MAEPDSGRRQRPKDEDGKRLCRCAARPSRTRRCSNYTADTYGGVQVCKEHALAMYQSLRDGLFEEPVA